MFKTSALVGLLATSAAITGLNPSLSATNQASTTRGARVSLTSNLATYTEMMRIQQGATKYQAIDLQTNQQLGELDPLDLICHGGAAEIKWYIGDLEPSSGPNIGIHISVVMDGQTVATLLKGGPTGIYNDSSQEIDTVVPCPIGTHHLAAVVTQITGGWGIPYANDIDRVQRGFIVSETY